MGHTPRHGGGSDRGPSIRTYIVRERTVDRTGIPVLMGA